MSERSETPPTFREIFDKASKSAFRGGLAGGAAMGANVACLMWMRTTVRMYRWAGIVEFGFVASWCWTGCHFCST